MTALAELRDWPADGEQQASAVEGAVPVGWVLPPTPVRAPVARQEPPTAAVRLYPVPHTPPSVQLPLLAVMARPLGRVKACCYPASSQTKPKHLVAAAVVTLAVIGALGWLDHVATPELPAETALVRVGAGETVWDVAQRVAPESDPRAVVEEIRHLNGIAGSGVRPGQQLRVPDGR